MSRHKCNLNLYMSYLQATSVRFSALALSEVSPMDMSHDSISRWLKDKKFLSKRIWKKVKRLISGKGFLVVDDTVVIKNRSGKMEIVSVQYSGTTHCKVKGINVITLAWYSLETGELIPIDVRICDHTRRGKKGWKTRNDLLREMVQVALDRGVNPLAAVMDTWYAGMNNLKFLRKKGLPWVSALKKNRLVDLGIRLEDLDIPKEGRIVHLRAYGKVKIIKMVSGNGRIDYVATSKLDHDVDEIKFIYRARWAIEVYHRELKQTCGIERCQSRSGRAQRNHILLAVMTWIRMFKEKLRSGWSFYQQKWQTVESGIKQEIAFLMEKHGTKLLT